MERDCASKKASTAASSPLPPQLLLREVVRERLGLRPAIDVWADGAALRHGLERETATAPAGMQARGEATGGVRQSARFGFYVPPLVQAAAVDYSSTLHGCVTKKYRELVAAAAPAAATATAGGGGAPSGPTPAVHPLAAVLQVRWKNRGMCIGPIVVCLFGGAY